MWDELGTIHNAHADYGPDEHRLMKRCQVMADRIFDPDFVREALGESCQSKIGSTGSSFPRKAELRASTTLAPGPPLSRG